jgi:hypothetical protein
MARSIPDIRDDIERTVRRRAAIYSRQSVEQTPELADIRAGHDAELRLLWEELRTARVNLVGLADFTPEDARRIIRHNPSVVLA